MFRVTVTSFWRFQDRANILADVLRRGQLRWYGHLKRKKKEECVSSCREFDVIGVKSKGRGSKTCERFVTHNSQLVNDLEYGDDMHANYFSRHSTSPNHRACIPWLDSRRLRSRECRGVTVRSIQLRWYPFLMPCFNVIDRKFFNTGSIRVES